MWCDVTEDGCYFSSSAISPFFRAKLKRSCDCVSFRYCVDFCGCCAGETASEIPDIFDLLGSQLNIFMSVGILLKYFRRKLL